MQITRKSALSLIILFWSGWHIALAQTAPNMVSAGDLQTLIQKAQPGDTLFLNGGRYAGPITIDRPIAIIGKNWPVIDGEERGTVIEITAPGVHLQGLKIIGSGKNLSEEDAGIALDAPDATIIENHLEDVLFGIYLRRAHRTVLRNNLIEGKKELDIPRRGDLIRAWSSDSLLIADNILRFGRDLIVWFSRNSVVRNNEVRYARYGIHFMYSDDCLIENNTLLHNSVGTFLMFSRRLTYRHNTVAYNRGASGFGLGVKDLDDGVIKENLIIDNRVGIFVDNSPRALTASMTYVGNVIAYNDAGFGLLSFVRRSQINKNSFIENYEQVAVTGAGFLTGNDWRGNYWSDYFGFDEDGDGIGDIPYKSEKLFEDLILRKPELRFFIYSPVIQAINFAAQAFPLVKPHPKVEDPAPLLQPFFPRLNVGIELRTNWPLLISGVASILFGLFLIRGFSGSRKKINNQQKTRSKSMQNIGKDSMPPHHKEEASITIARVSKSFGDIVALQNVSLTISSGECVALWGANGAGKTTLLRCILGVIPFEGTITINSFDIRKDGKKARYHIGFVPQEIQFHDHFSVIETIRFYAKLKKAPVERIQEWLETVGLQPHAEKVVKELSGGMKQRLALVIALLADPPILLLDEPTANLDMRSREEFLAILKKLKDSGKTIVFSSHRMTEVIPFADRIVVMEHGKVVADIPPGEAYSYLGRFSRIRIYLPEEQIEKAIVILQEAKFEVSRNGLGIKVTIDPKSRLRPIAILIDSGISIYDFEYELEH
ncbi:MAG: nitrous oxide reductase family maturation protein NosD [candidate division KSB1 bacterium]|nr:nitrous oxide reductase family maturation protein NosD [candidate division KSB1 bacterium]